MYGAFGLYWEETSLCQANGIREVVDLGVTQVSIRPTGGSNTTVLQDGAEVGGWAGANLSGRERLHGGEDQGQTVCYVFVRCTGQSWCVTFFIYCHDRCSSAQ